jgi:hypothetical protein
MERELDEAANRTAYFLAVHSGKLGFVLKTEHLKTSADTALCYSFLTARHTVRSIVCGGNLSTHFYWRGFRMCRSHPHTHSQSRSRTAATATITLRMIMRTGPLVGPNSIIPGLPEANAACKKEIGPRGRLFPRCENFFRILNQMSRC